MLKRTFRHAPQSGSRDLVAKRNVSRAYLGYVRVKGPGHETLGSFQVSQGVPEGAASAAEIPGRSAAIHQLLRAQVEQHAGLLEDLTLYALGDRVSVAAAAALLIHRRRDEAVLAPIQACRNVGGTMLRQHRLGQQSAPTTRYQLHLERSLTEGSFFRFFFTFRARFHWRALRSRRETRNSQRGFYDLSKRPIDGISRIDDRSISERTRALMHPCHWLLTISWLYRRVLRSAMWLSRNV